MEENWSTGYTGPVGAASATTPGLLRLKPADPVVNRATVWTHVPSHRIDDQNVYFNANCMILGSRAVLIWPNDAVPRTVLRFPGRKLFVTL